MDTAQAGSATTITRRSGEEAPVAAMAYLAREKLLLVAVKAQVLELKVP
jgi:hypothetical protein